MELYNEKLVGPQLHNLKAGIQKSEPMNNISLMAVIFYLISVLAGTLGHTKNRRIQAS